ncbi:hypothetical protein B4O97_04755 [Marispirochaeta aestuarii]|uniref:DUF4440 domain-containing protein n=1 Tax=Marispirochaeta aestuarii TaxID=1963862 RepID=A0A1Y1S1W9_9SPIO|nr:hypothetical protein [Marispirochaeta aestuarii]ORC36938.1 hypothetical protein B4O97_04755 [Marispirochaeta aestuarii]
MTDTNGISKKELIAREELLLNKGIRNDREQINRIVEENCIEIDEHGRKAYSSKAGLEKLDGVFYISDTASEMIMLSEDTALLLYEAVKTKNNSRTKANCSSIWKSTNGEWKVIFHQRTNLRE